MKRSVPLVAAMVFFASAACSAAGEWGAHLAALEAAAGQGDLKVQTELAAKYENAEGVPKDLQAANRLYCLAAKQGYAEAQFKLGWMYANGRGVTRDDGVAAALSRWRRIRGTNTPPSCCHTCAGSRIRKCRPVCCPTRRS